MPDYRHLGGHHPFKLSELLICILILMILLLLTVVGVANYHGAAREAERAASVQSR